VLTTRGGRFLPSVSVSVPIINQNAPYAALTVAQPITQLLKVRQAVNIAAADEQIAAAGYQKARREILKGVEQLYFGLLAAQRIRDGAATAIDGAKQYVELAKTPDARITLVQAQQAHFAAANQADSLAAQMNALLNLPLCSQLELSEPPPLEVAVTCECEAVNLALASNPDIYEAQQNMYKAMAAVNLAKSDFVPDVTLLAVGVSQDAVAVIQQREFAGIGIQASHTLFEWGKKKHTLHQRQVTLALASRNVQLMRDRVRLTTLKAFRKFQQDGQAVEYARQMLKWRKAAQKNTKSPAKLKEAVQARMEAEVAYIQVQAQYRVSYAELMSLTGTVGR
jgi:outer membrane protein TolC